MAYVATIGFFDGVHKGHRFLISELLRVSRLNGLQSAVLTFDEHPQSVLSGVQQPLLSTFDERTALLKATGVDEIFSFHFDVIQQMTAEEFMHILHERCGVEILLMGYDHQFGSDCMTDIADYEAAAHRVGMTIQPVTMAPNGQVSSSKIRRALQQGDMARANEMLGYTYTLCGEVVHGKGLGRTIGFPTANIDLPAEKMLPSHGVYAGEVIVEGVGKVKGMVNIGTNPTIGNDHVTVEVYLLDYTGDLYGQTISVQLVRRVREERKFENVAALQQQIKADIDSIRHQDVG